MTKKKPDNIFPLCPLCGEEYEAYGAAGKGKHWKDSHPKEWAEYKETVIMPNLKKAVKTRIDEAKKRKRKSRKQVPEEPQSEEAEGEAETEAQPPSNPEPIEKPPSGVMPQQLFKIVVPPDMDENIEILDSLSPQSDVRMGSTTIKPVRTSNFLEANVFAFTPKVFQFSSSLLHTVWQVTVEQWGWDRNMPMGTWMDTYFYMTMERLGVRLRSYEVLPQGGNGHGYEQQQERTSVHAADEQPGTTYPVAIGQ